MNAANHNPSVQLNGIAGMAPVTLSAKPGETVRLSAMGSSDRDGDELTYSWFQYGEPSDVSFPRAPALLIDGAQAVDASVVVPDVRGPTTYFVVLEVTDRGSPPLTSYRRAIIFVNPQAR